MVIHFTAMDSLAAARRRLCDPAAEVSAHYLIGHDGTTELLVPEEHRAWHAGAGQWAGRGDVNSRSIGIELGNCGLEPFPEAQMAALERLLPGIMARWKIPAHGVIGHSDMAPGRKADPGGRFDWRRLALGGLSVWPMRAVAVADRDAFRRDAQAFGYPDVTDDLLLSAFRLRFAPWRRGALTGDDCAEAADLARRFAVDAGTIRA
ncbi:MAG: N-acetylmuramoyl-L-alanine amidase [Pseudorhodobacter sp.]